MPFDLDVSVPVLTVFLQGLLSFLSPCVLPIIPLYMGYLSGGTLAADAEGNTKFSQAKVIANTIAFIVGISFAFFLLGLGFSAIGSFFTEYQMMFSRIGGIIVILLGFVQLGVFSQPFKGREFKLPLKINTLKMNPIAALLMGFVFSFAWTPCVGPALSTVLIMVSSANSVGVGLALMGVYTLGFTIPFLLVGIFTTQFLNFFKKHRSVVAYTVKIGGVLMILMGVMMFTGIMNNITGYLSTIDGVVPMAESVESENANSSMVDNAATSGKTEDDNKSDDAGGGATAEDEEESSGEPVFPAIDFELQDQFGNVHRLSDYEGKVIFLNFWATWCPPCREEMPDIQALYENYGYNQEDVIILGVASPRSEQNAYTQEQDEASVVAFLDENSYTYPTVLDDSGILEREYGITAYPTTFMIDANGNIFGYVPGMLTYDIMESIIQQTIDG